MAKTGRLVAGSLGIATGALAGYAYVRYRRDIRAARARVLAGSRVAETACGPIEYAAAGDGSPVLVVHGAGGGYDQGAFIARSLGPGWHWIAPSRFGYLRTPVPAVATTAAQADAHACLLDTLGIRRAAVVGVSAGAPSAVEFALRYPDRVTSLVVIAPAAYAPPEAQARVRPRSHSLLTDAMLRVALRSDLATWLAMKLAWPAMRYFLGVPPAVASQLTPIERAQVADLAQDLQPISWRQAGLLNEARNIEALGPLPLERITAPTLVVSAADDPFNTLPGARYLAEHIPGARLIALESGGHLLLGQPQAWASVREFLRQHTAAEARPQPARQAASTG